MAHLHYLTVQDILWINLEATKKVQHYNYARLEEATFYQFAYGESSSLIPQAGRFLTGFLKMHPFEAGNEATALIGCATFLVINGTKLDVADALAVDWLDKIMTKQVLGTDAVSSSVADLAGFHDCLKPDIRKAIKGVVGDYAETISILKNRSAVAK